MTKQQTGRHWAGKLCERLRKSDVEPIEPLAEIAGLPVLWLHGADWLRGAIHCRAKESRLVALWGDECGAELVMTACFEKSGDYLWLRCRLPLEAPEIASIAETYPAAARLERHCRDLLGVTFLDAADRRRWVRHQTWPEDQFPLRSDFSSEPSRATPADSDYPFVGVEGEAVCEIPVGPIHAGIIEPGHFRFHAVGETVLRLEERLGYVHKGIEKLAVGRDAAGLLRLAARVSGDTALGHAWAAARALEQIAGIEAPPRAQALRALLAERERVANHLGDIGAICNDVGFAFPQMQFSRLRELWLRRNGALFGHRLLMDTLVPGGVAIDLDGDGRDALLQDIEALRRELDALEPVLFDSQSLRRGRTLGTGVLSGEDARRLGCLGYVARASGLGFDARIDAPYGAYRELPVESVTLPGGDVDARLRVRQREIRVSLDLLVQLLENLAAGEVRAPWPQAAAGGEGFGEGFGIVEGWRGEIACCVRLDGRGRVARFFPRDPSWFNWLALEVLIHGNIVPDFPVCNKSVNASYSGHDL